jgi:hypothetical protein
VTAFPNLIAASFRFWDSNVEPPGYQIKLPHRAYMGGFDLFPAAGIDLDAFGLEWVRTYSFSIELRN